jgi:dihydrofolate synthase/folylpolyglutamate synthase
MADFHDYANSFQAHPRLGLERIRDLLTRLGNPQKQLRCIHIGGTNGKGSVAVFLDSILHHAGYRVGRYTSPNLVRVNERIVVDGEPIDDASLTALLSRIEPLAKDSAAALGEAVSQFEIWTAAAFTYFAQTRCDYVVLEVGMGGAYDATNVIDSCVMSVLTHIDLDHMQYLGSTPAEIARTKCGIIKDDCLTHTVVSAPQLPEVEQVIRREAEKHANTALFVSPPPPKKKYGMQEVFYFEGYGDIRSGLAGIHQIENACIALTCAKVLGIDIYDAQCGITYAKHPGRMEILRREPLLLYDGGHNPNGVQALVASLDRYLGDAPRTYLFACMADKDFLPSLRLLASHPAHFIYTTVQNNPRAMGAEQLAAAAAAAGIAGESAPTLAEAIRRATEVGLPTVICGSLYLYADLPECYRSI